MWHVYGMYMTCLLFMTCHLKKPTNEIDHCGEGVTGLPMSSNFFVYSWLFKIRRGNYSGQNLVTYLHVPVHSWKSLHRAPGQQKWTSLRGGGGGEVRFLHVISFHIKIPGNSIGEEPCRVPWWQLEFCTRVQVMQRRNQELQIWKGRCHLVPGAFLAVIPDICCLNLWKQLNGSKLF